MRKFILLTFMLAGVACMGWADSKETVTVNGSVVDKFATRITFNGDQLTLTFADGNTLTEEIDKVAVDMNYVAVFSDAAGFDNVKTIKTFGQKNVDVEVRRAVKAGQWNTICLPFSMTAEEISTVFGEGTKVAQLEKASAENINFETVDAMKEGIAYIIQPQQEVTTAFHLDGALVANVAEGARAVGEAFALVGTINSSVPDGDVYYIANGNKIKKLTAGSAVKALHAYLLGKNAASNEMTFSVDGEVTGIAATLLNDHLALQKVYNLNGQLMGSSVNGLPHGVYIVNGKKILIK